MGASAIVAVRQAVVAAIEALPEFADVDVMYSYEDKGGREIVYTREATFEHNPASMRSGRNYREETGQFEVAILVMQVGGTPEEASVRALDLGLPIEEWVADNKSGVADTNWLLIKGGGSLSEGTIDQASIAELVYTIQYNARLT